MYLLVDTVGVAIGKGFVSGWLYEVMFGSLLGPITGLLFSKLMKLSHHKVSWIESHTLHNILLRHSSPLESQVVLARMIFSPPSQQAISMTKFGKNPTD